jgi:hypothetical protein
MTSSNLPTPQIRKAVDRFVAWLDQYGEVSHDHQSFFAGPLGRAAKDLYYRRPRLGTLAVAPMIFCEAFVPGARRFFFSPQRFPIADAHYAIGFALLFQVSGEEQHYRRAVHFLEVLEKTRCPGFDRHAWGYPFDWQTRIGTLTAGTPLITTVPYVYEAFQRVYLIDKDDRWRQVMRSIANHALLDYREKEIAPGVASCAYTPNPGDRCDVVNASAYRAGLLARASREFDDPAFAAAAERNRNFVLSTQNTDGSWYYSIDGERDFVDHFHTCFVLKGLAAIDSPRCADAIERGVDYYVANLFDERRLPRPFSRAPRLTVYRRELYDYAECINLATVLRGRYPALDYVLRNVIDDLLERWRKRDGSFRSRELLAGWDNVPMHRWAQAQLFRSLCLLLAREMEVS